MDSSNTVLIWLMEFPQRLAQLRKARSYTQQVLADKAGVHVIQIKRYEGGESQPTLEVIRNISVALGVTADELIFGKDGRGPDEDLRLQFEAISKFSDEDKKTVKEVLQGLILKNEAKKWG